MMILYEVHIGRFIQNENYILQNQNYTKKGTILYSVLCILSTTSVLFDISDK